MVEAARMLTDADVEAIVDRLASRLGRQKAVHDDSEDPAVRAEDVERIAARRRQMGDTRRRRR